MRQTFVLSLALVVQVIFYVLFVTNASVKAYQEPTAVPSVPGKTILVGPETEKRFPPFKLPAGFKATLFACDPLVEYPSVIALGPEPNSLFVAHDYMTGLGTEIVRRDEIRIIRDTDADGYADTSGLYAKGFNSIQGLAYHAGEVYVMHAPLLTSLKDTTGDGKADQRKDIVNGLGLPPEKNPGRLHCANGVVVGHDGWLYLALGDRGCDVTRYEGDRLLFQQGGILRCRPDGSDLHVFSSGLRNIYDIALDEELNVFVRDNENDGGDYMIRVCHSFHGADHGYPYLYYERPYEALLPVADLGRGSSAGGTSYLEAAFPKEYQESLFFCEWGRAVVRYHLRRAGGGFTPMKEIEFAAAAPTDPYGLKPTDLVVDYDGSLLISDWGDGQRPKRGRARIYRITHVDTTKRAGVHNSVSEKTTWNRLISKLNSNSYHARVAAQDEIQRRGTEGVTVLKQAIKKGNISTLGRMHAVWIIAQVGGSDSVDDLFHLAATDANHRVRAQAVRVIADLTDPILSEHRVTARQGDPQIASRLAALVKQNRDPRVVLEVLVALGRLHWPSAPDWLREHWSVFQHDSAIDHAAQQLLRRSNNWSAVVKLLDESDVLKPNDPGLRTLALRAVANRADTTVVDGLIARLKTESNSKRRGDYADLLSRIHKQPAPWVYWGFRPAPRPANTVDWERTEAIENALNGTLADPNSSIRMLVLKRMQREKISMHIPILAEWLRKERDAKRVTAILEAFKSFQPSEVQTLHEAVVRDKSYADQNRLTALASLSKDIDASQKSQLLKIAYTLDEGEVLAALLRDLGKRSKLDSHQLLLGKLDSKVAVVRAAAMDSLAMRNVLDASPKVISFLKDSDIRVRRSAASAAGLLQVTQTAKSLRKFAGSNDPGLCRAALESLKLLKDPRVVPEAVAALNQPATQLAALSYLENHGGPGQIESLTKLAETNRSMDLLTGVVRAFTNWNSKQLQNTQTQQRLERAVATIQSNSGVLLHWSAHGPFSVDDASRLIKRITNSKQSGEEFLRTTEWGSLIAAGTDASIRLQPDSGKKKSDDSIWLAVSNLFVNKQAEVEFLTASNGTLQVWLNGRSVFHRNKPAAYRPNSDRFEVPLVKGTNRLLVKIDNPTRDTRFHLRFRRKSSKADHERLVRLALTSQGNVQRGRELFLKAEKSQCIKCHRLGEHREGRIGPDLTGIGNRFSRIHLIESILEPSRTVATSYATVVIALSNGRVLTGVKIAETEKTITLGDNQGKTHMISKSEIDEQQMQAKSTMPDDLAKRLSDREFFDLLSFLLSEKQNRSN